MSRQSTKAGPQTAPAKQDTQRHYTPGHLPSIMRTASAARRSALMDELISRMNTMDENDLRIVLTFVKTL